MMLDEISKIVRRKTGVKITARDVERVISALKTSDNFWTVVGISGVPIPCVAQIVKELGSGGYLRLDDRIKLLERFQSEFRGIFAPIKLSCEACSGRSISFDGLGIYERFMEIQKSRPMPIQEYDQGYITPESTLSRVAFAIDRGDVVGRKIVVLGDDDLVSLALGLTNMSEEIVVLEIDERLAEFINNIANKHKIKVETYVFDLKGSIPDKFMAYFDTFFTDPPEALKAFCLFVAKGVYTLKGEGSAGYFGLTQVDSSLSKWRKIQKFVTSTGACITDIIRDFNEYVTWDYHEKTLASRLAPLRTPPDGIWYRSAFVRIEIVDKPKRINEQVLDENIYIDKESTTT